MSDVNALDLAFVVDTTGSMGSFIDAARKQMVDMVAALVRSQTIDLRLGVVEYRDHPPQDNVLKRVHPLTDDLEKVRKDIAGLRPDGGGDGPEAVFDGIKAACDKLSWRPTSRRLLVLVGDAPPHGVGGRGDGFPRGCPCGETIESITAAVEEARATLYALGLTHEVRDSFGRLSRGTGGDYFDSGSGPEAITRVEEVLQREFRQLDLDRRLLELHHAGPRLSLETLAERLGSNRPAISAAVSRLGSRGLL